MLISSVPNSAPVVPRPTYALRIIAVGDSLIYGFGDPTGGGWVERLRRHWMAESGSSHALYNLGVRGNRVAQVKTRLKAEFEQRGELNHRVPDLIVLSVGVNDSPRLGRSEGRNLTNFETFTQQIASLLELALQLSPVLFVGMVPVEESRMPFLNCLYYNHDDQYRYKEATKRACSCRQIPYLDLFELWMARGSSWLRGYLGPDGLHPNVRGYQAMLQDISSWEPFSQLSSKGYQSLH